MNNYLKNLNRIEFIVTDACTGKCKHCSQGALSRNGIYLESEAAVKAVYEISDEYGISSVMTFGGEPLLNPGCVYAVHRAATEMKIPKRQLITNGFFSDDKEKIKVVAKKLAECGVNDILLSADAFHQETIPIETVKLFAYEILNNNLSIRINPAWLVSKEHINSYNIKTKEITEEIIRLGVLDSPGNIIFPEGNALKYLSEYFSENEEYTNPYAEDEKNLKSVSIEADGGLFGSNIYKESAKRILESYKPWEL